MADTPTPADDANLRGNPQQQQEGAPHFIWTVLRWILIWMVVRSFLGGGGNSGSTRQNESSGGKKQVATPKTYYNLLQPGEQFSLYVFIDESIYHDFDASEPVLEKHGLYYEWDIDVEFATNISIAVTDHLLYNNTLYAHFYLVRDDHSIDTRLPRRIYAQEPLVRFFEKKKEVVKQQLLGISDDEKLSTGASDGRGPTEVPESIFPDGDNAGWEDNEDIGWKDEDTAVMVRSMWDSERNDDTAIAQATSTVNLPLDGSPVPDGAYIPYWQPLLDITLVIDQTTFNGAIPHPLNMYIKADKRTGTYRPVFLANDFWTTRERMIPINATLDSVPLEIRFSPVSLWKYQLINEMSRSFNQQREMGLMTDQDVDEMKRLIVETNPYLLGVTVVVSLLHMILDFLAFKNDIAFWKNRDKQSLEGLSIRTVFLNSFFGFVIFLYLLDNDTSWMILLSSGVGCIIDFWKIKKAAKVSWDPSNRLKGFIPFPVKIENRDSYVSKTKEYDDLAMHFLGYLMFPLCFGYALYSLAYDSHKSYYSWILSSGVGFIYMFGFIMMSPQLFINYKLKSVAHLPWRTFMYKAINTFIDDLFAFIIKMPIMHRLSCFRDDLIFFVYLYQRWIYPVDMSRTNEFGFSGDDVKEHEKRQAKQPVGCVAGGATPSAVGTVASAVTGEGEPKGSPADNPGASSTSETHEVAGEDGSDEASKVSELNTTGINDVD